MPRRRKQPFFGPAVLTACCLFPAVFLQAGNLSFKGQASVWFSLNDEKPAALRFGFRYIPTLSATVAGGKSLKFDVEASFNAFASGASVRGRKVDSDGDIAPYRMWIRASSSQFELRLGLQKINFGSASLLRPLMWFDRVDARDPLQITDGVKGVLFRYYFVSNANVWIWGLMSNGDPKGWESAPTRKRAPEYGGRVQLPLFKGEIAATYHHRTMDLRNSGEPAERPFAGEDRWGFDGKWDVGIGVWFEGVIVRQNRPALVPSYERLYCMGADTTLGIGNGLHVLTEFFRFENADRALGRGSGFGLSALSLQYPAGLLDNFSAILYYDWTNRKLFRFLSWQRTYDRWQFIAIGFWNPRGSAFFRIPQGNNAFGGWGLQIMAVFNH